MNVFVDFNGEYPSFLLFPRTFICRTHISIILYYSWISCSYWMICSVITCCEQIPVTTITSITVVQYHATDVTYQSLLDWYVMAGLSNSPDIGSLCERLHIYRHILRYLSFKLSIMPLCYRKQNITIAFRAIFQRIVYHSIIHDKKHAISQMT